MIINLTKVKMVCPIGEGILNTFSFPSKEKLTEARAIEFFSLCVMEMFILEK